MDLLQTHNISCPYCGETISIVVDCSIETQDYIEDCQVCCRPIIFIINIDGEFVNIQVSDENE